MKKVTKKSKLLENQQVLTLESNKNLKLRTSIRKRKTT
ncbi:DUF536 domain-containing protein [Staphylococcus warneri]|nr:DUF536 domain-containing protein [Staphylococcus warneri]